ncbi:ArnT family glycosyltransferase [Candidatus Omnitrophota bacterium]
MLLTMPAYLLDYRNEDVAAMINLLFLAITFLMIFKICKEYFNAKIAVLSCFILSVYPVIYVHMRGHLMDICLTAIVTASMYVLLKCDGFRSPKYSMLLGSTMALGMWCRQYYPVFILGPFIYVIYKSGVLFSVSRENSGHQSSLWEPRWNFLYCSIIALGLTAAWYLPNFKETLGLIFYNNSPEWAIKFMSSSMSSVGYFLIFFAILLTYNGLSFLFTFLFLSSGVRFFFFKSYKKFDIKKVFMWWILLPFLLITFSLNKQARFYSPALPAVAIISAWGIYQIRKRLLRGICIGIILVVGFFQFFVDSFNVPLLYELSFRPLGRRKLVLFTVRQNHRTRGEDWKLREVLGLIKENMAQQRLHACTVMLLSDHKAFNANTLDYYSSKEELGIKFVSVAWIEDVSAAMKQRDFRYLIYKDKNNDAGILLNKQRLSQAFSYLVGHSGEFKVIHRLSLDDNSHIVVYRRI